MKELWSLPYLALILCALAGCSQHHKATMVTVTQVEKSIPARCADAGNPKGFLEKLDKQAAKQFDKESVKQSAEDQQWIGCPIDMLTVHWGAPVREVPLPGGAVVLHWETDRTIPRNLVRLSDGSIYNPGPKHEACSADVTVNQSGVILGIKAVSTGLLAAACHIEPTSGPNIE